LILFAREPVAGSVKTRLVPALGRAGAARLYAAFTADLCAALAPRFALTIACSPDPARPYFRGLARRHRVALVPQGDGDLGARMRRMATAALARRSRVVIVGSDIPTLPPDLVESAFRALRRRRVVLGPSLDGGYYLIGLRAPVPDVFSRMPWGGPRVLERTLARLRRERIGAVLLPPWYDVDTPADVALLADHLRVLAPAGTRPCPRTARVLATMRRRVRG
jgi:rSAM/selenodomain-associated transferase 1